MLDHNHPALDYRAVTPGQLSGYFRLLFWAALIIIFDFYFKMSYSYQYPDEVIINRGTTTGANISLLPDFVGIALCICVIRGLRNVAFTCEPPRHYRQLLLASEGAAWMWIFVSGASMAITKPESPLWGHLETVFSFVSLVGTACFYFALVQLCGSLGLKSIKWWLLCLLCQAIMGLNIAISHLPAMPEDKSTSLSMRYFSLSASGPFLGLAVASLCAMVAGLVFFLIGVVATRLELLSKFPREGVGHRFLPSASALIAIALVIAPLGVFAKWVCFEGMPGNQFTISGSTTSGGTSYDKEKGYYTQYSYKLYNTRSKRNGILALYSRTLFPARSNGSISFSSGMPANAPRFAGYIKADARTGIIDTPNGEVKMDSPFVLFYTDPNHVPPVRIDIPLDKQKELAAMVHDDQTDTDEVFEALEEILPKLEPADKSDVPANE